MRVLQMFDSRFFMEKLHLQPSVNEKKRKENSTKGLKKSVSVGLKVLNLYY